MCGVCLRLGGRQGVSGVQEEKCDRELEEGKIFGIFGKG